MITYACCSHCRVPVHLRERPGSAWRDDHPHPCAKCTADERGRQQVVDPILPMLGRLGRAA